MLTQIYSIVSFIVLSNHFDSTNGAVRDLLSISLFITLEAIYGGFGQNEKKNFYPKIKR